MGTITKIGRKWFDLVDVAGEFRKAVKCRLKNYSDGVSLKHLFVSKVRCRRYNISYVVY